MSVMAVKDREPEDLLRSAVPRQAQLYAVVDAARSPAGPYQAELAELAQESLFAGDMGERLKGVAPYVIEFPLEGPFLHWWFGEWGESAGILVEAPIPIAALRKHFRTLLMVKDDSRKRYYFRFYDPRVLRAFLPACTPAELEHFFGPITAIHCESDGGDALVTYRRTSDGLDVTTRPLAPGK